MYLEWCICILCMDIDTLCITLWVMGAYMWCFIELWLISTAVVAIIGVIIHAITNDRPVDMTWEHLSCTALEWAGCLAILPANIGWFSSNLPPLPPTDCDTDKNNPHPIILVPGYSLNKTSFLALRIYLGRLGYSNIWAINNPVHKDDITEFIENLHQCVEEYYWRHQRPITLIGHSMGGLIARHYIAKYGKEKVHSLVTIGTPWHGTLMHNLGLGKHVHQMKPHSVFCANPTPPDCPHLYIWSDRDWIVLPNSHAVVTGANQWKISSAGHLGMLGSVAVFKQIFDFLPKTSSVATQAPLSTESTQHHHV